MATAKDVIRVAVAEIGVTEYPPKSNNVKYNTAYYGREVYGDDEFPWCMVFDWYCFREAGASELFYGGERTASCPTLARWAQKIGRWVTSDYQPGDVVIFDFDKYDEWPYEHTGILEQVVDNGVYYVIEGNTSTSSDDNGGAVMRRRRYDSQIAGAYRPPYDEEEEDEDMTLDRFKELMKEYRAELQDNDAGTWSPADREWAVTTGLIKGSTTLPDGSPNYMWEDFLTREQAVALMHRLAKMLGAE